MATRSADKRLSVLLETPGEEHRNISGCKLPTFKQVLLCFLAHLDVVRDSLRIAQAARRSAAKIVQEKVIYHYRNAGIDYISNKRMCDKIVELHTEYTNIRKLPAARLKSHCHLLKKFNDKLEKTMPFWPKDIILKMKARKGGHISEIEKAAIEEDIQFLQSMFDDRKATYAVKDTVTPLFEVRREDKRKRARAGTSKEDPFEYDRDEEGIEEAGDDYSAGSADSAGPQRKHRRTKTGDWMFIPHDILKRPRIVAFATRNKLSTTVASSFIRELMSECGADPSKISSSHMSAFR